MITVLIAKENNLKAVNLHLPTNKLIVVTGVSGSGKSTLVYDVIFKEARRRYLESFSSNARLFMGKLASPDVQYLSGLSPAIALDQKDNINSPKSTVGTLTEIYDLLRLLFARVGKPSANFPKELTLDRSLFSFNTEKGACPECQGLGVTDAIDEEGLIGDENKTIRQGAFVMTTPKGYIVYSQVTMAVLNQVCKAEGFSVDIPWKELTPEQRNVVLFGSQKLLVPFGKHPLESRMKWTGITAKPREEGYYKGIVPIMDEILKRDRNPNVLRFAKTETCRSCGGTRLRSEVQEVCFHEKTITQISSMSIDELIVFFENIPIPDHEKGLVELILQPMLKTAKMVQKLGLGFLTIHKPSQSLTGSETQRLRLAKMATSGLRNILYVFDEPSVGLHPIEVPQLLEVLYALRDQENTVILVEHNPLMIQHADWVVDLGPEAGKEGGYVLFSGKTSEFFSQEGTGNSKTLEHFRKGQDFKEEVRAGKLILCLKKENDQDVRIQTEALNVVTGVSSSGKREFIHQAFRTKTNEKRASEISESEGATGMFSKISIQEVDQSSIGKTPRSNPATYVGLADEIRTLFANQKEAKERGFTQNHFSFNTQAGCCEKCQGAGYKQIGMQLLGTVELLCSVCAGKQFKPEVLEVQYQGKTIAEIYALTIDEAVTFFHEAPKILPFLQVMQKLGLGYLTLNQRSSTLSGGEARRIKLAKHLVKKNRQPAFFIIDEPSSGLHPYDVEKLLLNLNELVDQKHTIVMLDQNPEVMKQADHLIEFGSGKDGFSGKIVYQGPPRGVLNEPSSFTAKFLTKKEQNVDYTPRNVFERQEPIRLQAVSTHNLKNIDVEIPFNKMTVLTGVSGSGKSSLAFDTLFMEGRQRYTESFSAYVRNRLNINSSARYERIEGLMPTLAVDQKSITTNERATVGTITDIDDSIRFLFARVGQPQLKTETPRASWFSFNHEEGACPGCHGLGYQWTCDPEKLISDPEKPLMDGAMNGSKTGQFIGDAYGQYMATLLAVGKKHHIDFSKPWNRLTDEAKILALEGSGNEEHEVEWKYKRRNREGTHSFKGTWNGLLHLVNEEYLRKAHDKRGESLLPIMKKESCILCQGSRINKRALGFKVLDATIDEWRKKPVSELAVFLKKQVVVPNSFSPEPVKQKAAQVLTGRILNGLDILIHLGLGYLALTRRAGTLSGGEGQRVRLASAINQDLSGLCVVLDEPTRGLHPKDTENLIFILQELKRQGNTVVVCEHDPYFINSADHIIELGPGAGKFGGHVVAEGMPTELANSLKSITGPYLKVGYSFERTKRVVNFIKSVQVQGAHANNLKNSDVRIPANVLVVLTGVSGSGKSSLMREVIYQSAIAQRAVNCKQISGLGLFDQFIYVSQKLPKSHFQNRVASFLGMDEPLSVGFLNASKNVSGTFTKAQFKSQQKAGYCPDCQGQGENITRMDFLSDVHEECPGCQGTGFNNLVLQIQWNHRNISQVMQLSLEELSAMAEFKTAQELALKATHFGLGYLTLNQPLHTLSGGEWQRLWLLKSLMEQQGKACLFMLDEPTTGLHMYDVEKLMTSFDRLLDAGHSLLVIEHHQTVIGAADYQIELGPGAGESGGNLVFERETGSL